MVNKETIPFSDGFLVKIETTCRINRKNCREKRIVYGFCKEKIDPKNLSLFAERSIWELEYFTIDVNCPSNYLTKPRMENRLHIITFPVTEELLLQIGLNSKKITPQEYSVINPGCFIQMKPKPGEKIIECLALSVSIEFWQKVYEILGWKKLTKMIEFDTSARNKPQILCNLESLLISQITRPMELPNIHLIENSIFQVGIWLVSNHPSKIQQPKFLRMDPRLCRAIEFLQNNFNRDIKLDDISRTSGMSQRHLERMFKQEVGQSPLKYLTSCRLGKAMELLKQPHITVEEIASQVGYKDIRSLRKAFVTTTKHPPSAFQS